MDQKISIGTLPETQAIGRPSALCRAASSQYSLRIAPAWYEEFNDLPFF
jgi:hypothetical protein